MKHVVQSAFDGRRIVIFSGGSAISDEKLIEEVTAPTMKAAGSAPSSAASSFQRPKAEAIKMLHQVMDIHAGKAD